jgi:hypothetical protein
MDMEVLFRVEGKMSTFGGPKDTGMGADEGIALFSSEQDMKNHGLGDFLLSEQEAGFPGLGRRLNPDKPYFACRWWESGLSRELLRKTWASIENSKTGAKTKARPVDSGPAEKTGRVADLSPSLARQLDLRTDDICIVTIGDQTSEFGVDVDHTIAAASLAFSGPRIYSTDEWGAQPAKVSFFPTQPAVGIVIHNTEYANRDPLADPTQERNAAFANARDIQRDHMQNRGWSDTGQHFTVSQGGVITEGRHGTLRAAREGLVVRGAHSPGANDEWWGIEIAGDNRQQFVVAVPQWNAVIDLCTWLMKLVGREIRIEPHNHFKSTTCPGHIVDHLDELRTKVRGRLNP